MLGARSLVLSVALLQTTLAFEGSAPLLAWSSFDRPELFNAQRLDVQNSLIESVLSSNELCGLDAAVVISHPGLHATDLRSLPSTTFLSEVTHDVKRSLSIPYMTTHSPSELRSAAEGLSSLCKEQYVELEMSSATPSEMKENGVYYLTLPIIYGDGTFRRQRVEAIERELAGVISHVEQSFSRHIIIYAGSSLPDSDLYKRQMSSHDSHLFSFANGTHKSAEDKDGIFHRYTLFTPGLIVALAVVLFLLVPILLAAVRSLASIQSSVRLDAPKGPGLDKKNQ